MKRTHGAYIEHGRRYPVNICVNCFASVTMTITQLTNIRKYGGHVVLHEYFDTNIPCCDKPNFYWRNL